MPDFLDSRLLVTGAGGHLGALAVKYLLAKGAKHVAAGSRNPAKLADLSGRGVRTLEVDFDDTASLSLAFEGVDRALIVSTDALGIPGKRQRQHLAAVAAAAKAGVKHIVYTSMPNPGPGSLIPFAPDHHETELAIERSGLGYTILRNNWYCDNLVMSLPQVLASGQWYTSAGQGRAGYVVRDDAARMAAAALIGEKGSARYDVTGPEALTTAEVATIASGVFGKPIKVIAVSDEQLAGGMKAAGLPAPLVELLVAMDANTRIGKVDIVSDAVTKLTGKAPQTIRAYLSANRALFGQHAQGENSNVS